MRTYFTLLLLLSSITYAEQSYIFPPGFLKGCAISAYQNGGSKWGINNWDTFQDQTVLFNAKTILGPTIARNQKIGNSVGFYEHAFEDINLLKELGCNSFRFSVEWSEIETAPGVWNEQALQFYEAFCDALLENHITPMITLHHFTNPVWFQKMGGFELEENIPLFVNFAKKIFDRLGSKVKLWCTINEPTVVSACGYLLGIHPPGRVFQIRKAGIVLRNLLNAHVATYQALKSMPHGQEAQIGIVHQVLNFEPYVHTLLGFSIKNPLGAVGSKLFNFSFAHNTTLLFLKTGIFSYRVPFIGTLPIVKKLNVYGYNRDAPTSYDFVGINFYSKVILGPQPTHYKDQIRTDMEYAMRPELLYDAIAQISKLGKPVYITENGIPDRKDAYRERWILEHLKFVHKAVEDGLDVRGFFYWTLMDNFEWNDGFDMKFGLYQANRFTKKRSLRKGATAFRDAFCINRLPTK